MPRTSPEQVSEHQVVDARGLQGITIRNRNFDWSGDTALSKFEGVQEVALLGPANEDESLADGHLSREHGFVLRALKIEPDATVPEHVRKEEEVIFVQQGSCRVNVEGESLELTPGDTFTTPIGSNRSFTNPGREACTIYITRRSNQPKAPEFK
jgi:quercetin dioxygenase-like cupin family protein